MNEIASRRSTVLVLHPDPLLRAGLVAALRQHSAFETLVNGADLRNSDDDDRRIDVVITDYENAMHLAPSLHPALHKGSTAKLLILTNNDREADIRRALEAGIHGYIMLGSSLDDVIDGVTTVANGLRYVSRSVAQRMADSLTHTCLTSREMEVLSLVAGGESNKAIARHLDIQSGTVKSHMTAILAKLGATSRTQAASIAIRRGLVEQHTAAETPGGIRRREAPAAAAWCRSNVLLGDTTNAARWATNPHGADESGLNG